MGEIQESLAGGETVGVLFIDLDHFKAVNDLYGHATGDGVLVQVAQRLLAACGEDDTVARLGGDEFAVLHPALASPQDAAALAERIVRMVSVPIQVNGYEVILGASIGIAVAPGDGSDAETLMKNADLAAYRAKADGRGAFHFFEPGLDAALQERRSFEMELRGALVRNELSLVFQPLVSLSDNRISSVEALLRWNHPTRGLVMPDRLIPAAERSGLIGPIGEWVLRESCLTAATWPKDVTVSVNVSPVQFSQGQLARQVEDALRLSGLEPARLHIEVTETALLVDNASTLATLEALRRLGVLISLDDFGTGYSSLGYLRTFRFDKIKIDRSFVHDLSGETNGLAITKAIIALGQNLGIATAAEGVETEAQFEFVRDQGCTEVQGYIFSPPVPASAIARVLADERDDGAMPAAAWRRRAGDAYSGRPAARRPPM
jgi:diguanylate cyclase (GGDEF)-like protein